MMNVLRIIWTVSIILAANMAHGQTPVKDTDQICKAAGLSDQECEELYFRIQYTIATYADVRYDHSGIYDPDALHQIDYNFKEDGWIPYQSYLDKWREAVTPASEPYTVASVKLDSLSITSDGEYSIALILDKIVYVHSKNDKKWIETDPKDDVVRLKIILEWPGFEYDVFPLIKSAQVLSKPKSNDSKLYVGLHGLMHFGSSSLTAFNNFQAATQSNLLQPANFGFGIMAGKSLFNSRLVLVAGADIFISNQYEASGSNVTVTGDNAFVSAIQNIDDPFDMANSEWEWHFDEYNEVLKFNQTDLSLGIQLPLLPNTSKLMLSVDIGGIYSLYSFTFGETSFQNPSISSFITFEDGYSINIDAQYQEIDDRVTFVGKREGLKQVSSNYNLNSHFSGYGGLQISWPINERLHLYGSYRYVLSLGSSFSTEGSGQIYGDILTDTPSIKSGFLSDYFEIDRMARHQIRIGFSIGF